MCIFLTGEGRGGRRMVVPEVFLFNLYFAAWISYWTWISSLFFKLCLYPSCVCVFFYMDFLSFVIMLLLSYLASKYFLFF